MTDDASLLTALTSLLAERFGIRADAPALDLAGAVERARLGRQRSRGAYLLRLLDGREALEPVVEELVVDETYFFRDGAQLDLLAREVLPALAAAQRGQGLRVWCAGCSSGEEAYTLAVMLIEAGLAKGSSVVATDASAALIAAARLGEYNSFSFRGEGAERMSPHVEPRGRDRWRVRQPLRQLVSFAVENLVATEAPALGGSRFDLIVCRNVLVYFDPEGVARAADRLAGRLAARGWLACGASDPPLDGLGSLRLEFLGDRVVYRLGPSPARGAAPAFASGPPSPLPGIPQGAVDRDPSRHRSLAEATPHASATAPGPREEPARALVTEADGRRVDTWVAAAQAHLAAGRPRAALDAARRATYAVPDHIMASFTLGTSAARSGELGTARRALRAASRLAAAEEASMEVHAGGGLKAGEILRLAIRELKRLGSTA